MAGEIETAKSDIFSKYPNADRARTNAFFLYVMCESIFQDQTLQESEKREEFRKVRKEIIEDDAPSSSLPEDLIDKILFARSNLSYVQSILGTPRIVYAGGAVFERGGYKITVGYNSDEEQEPQDRVIRSVKMQLLNGSKYAEHVNLHGFWSGGAPEYDRGTSKKLGAAELQEFNLPTDNFISVKYHLKVDALK